MSFAKTMVALLAGVVLASCGGGSGNDAAAPVSGLYEGSGGSLRASEFLILEDGRLYLVYGLNSASATPMGGVIVGNGAASGNAFASSNVHDTDFQAQTLKTGTLTSTLAARVSADTSVMHSDGSGALYAGTFVGTSTGNASLGTLAGTYGGELAAMAGRQVAALTIDASGVIAGTTTGGCTVAGLALPHGGLDAYDITIGFQNGCPAAGSTLHGHAFLRGRVLYVVTASGDLNTVVAFSGVKP